VVKLGFDRFVHDICVSSFDSWLLNSKHLSFELDVAEKEVKMSSLREFGYLVSIKEGYILV
jgi:hypothetical protein